MQSHAVTYDSFLGFGFNRYAYCMYNPLKYIDPSGEQYLGWDPSLMNRIEQEAKRLVWQCWQVVYDDISMSHAMTVLMANCLFSQGQQNAGNGSGHHGSPGGGGDNITGNGQGDGKPTNNSNSAGRPGSSENNPTTGNNLFNQCYLHYQIGEGTPLYVDATSLGLGEYSIYEDFKYNEKTGRYSINLFSNPYMFDNPQLAMALGQIELIPLGNNMYALVNDRYDFDFQADKNRWDYGLFNWRNTATFCGGLIHGSAFNVILNMTPMFFGGPFDIIFTNNNVYIPYYP